MIKILSFQNRLFFLSFIIVLISCSKEEVYLTGNIIGSVYCYDNNYIQYEDINVTLIGYSREEITYTDSTGRYVFKNIRAGTYDILFKINGYDAFELSGIQHLGGESTIIPFYSIYLGDL